MNTDSDVSACAAFPASGASPGDSFVASRNGSCAASVAANNAGIPEIAFVLLVLQAGIGLVSALGTLVWTLAGGVGGGAGIALLLAFGTPIALLIVAAGIGARRTWARRTAIGFECLVLLGALVRVLLSRGAALNLVMLLTTVAIPLGVSALLFTRAARSGAAQRPSSLSSLLPQRLPGGTGPNTGRRDGTVAHQSISCGSLAGQ